jgi:hypothetical protein
MCGETMAPRTDVWTGWGNCPAGGRVPFQGGVAKCTADDEAWRVSPSAVDASQLGWMARLSRRQDPPGWH